MKQGILNYVMEIVKKTFSDKKIAYTGIVLNTESQRICQSLIDKLKYKYSENFSSDGWAIVGDHITLWMGPSTDRKLINKKVSFSTAHVAFNDRVCALKVILPNDFPNPENKVMHITLMYNRGKGATPKESRDLQNWRPLGKKFLLSGTIQEVTVTF